jgi:radical SAM protein with 4Fe4S-binding SPASM domain
MNLIYLKTTETCNLNCKHCFTSGKNGKKIFWDHVATADWLCRLRNEVNNGHVHLEFHGGEPFLADLDTLQYVFNECNGLWESMTWGATTNLTYNLTSDIIKFIRGPLGNRIATSWDTDIRFANPKQYDLWRSNVSKLIDLGVTVKLFVSVSAGLLKLQPHDFLEWVRDLGVAELSLERITHDGNANIHPDIFPNNVDQDKWFLDLHHASVQLGADKWFINDFFESVYDKFSWGTINTGTFCRDCEEKLFTVNADGTIAGCPNSAPTAHFGHISDNIQTMLSSPQRINNIVCEKSRNSNCFGCEVFQYCGGDCHQLPWQDNVCGAPKSLMKYLSNAQTKKVWSIKEI